MKAKWMNTYNIILCIFLLTLTKSNKTKLSVTVPVEIINFQHQDLWHPHLKRKWLDDKNYVIYDNRKKIYATSLIQLNTDSGFLSKSPTDQSKMQCGCRFLKQDIINKQASNINSNASFIEIPTQNKPSDLVDISNQSEKNLILKNLNENLVEARSNNRDNVVNSYMENLNQNLKYNNILMSKIEHILEQQSPVLNKINGNGYTNNFLKVTNPLIGSGNQYTNSINLNANQLIQSNNNTNELMNSNSNGSHFMDADLQADQLMNSSMNSYQLPNLNYNQLMNSNINANHLMNYNLIASPLMSPNLNKNQLMYTDLNANQFLNYNQNSNQLTNSNINSNLLLTNLNTNQLINSKINASQFMNNIKANQISNLNVNNQLINSNLNALYAQQQLNQMQLQNNQNIFPLNNNFQ